MNFRDIAEAFQTTALNGSLLLALAVAAAAGLVAFLSPCVLPVVPGYLGYVSGLAGQSTVGPLALNGTTGQRARTSQKKGRRGGGTAAQGTRGGHGRMVLGAMLFVLGFTAVFMALGGFAGALGHLLQAHMVWVNRIAGVIVIVMGLVFCGAIPGGGTRGPHGRADAGLWGAPLMGIIFGLSWTPCIGPTYAAILALSLDGGNAMRGALLSLAYSLGLGLPFVAFALLFERALGFSRMLARHRRAIGIVSGVLLIGIGILLFSGLWTDWMMHLQTMFSGFEPVV